MPAELTTPNGDETEAVRTADAFYSQLDLVASLTGLLFWHIQTVASAAESDEASEKGWQEIEVLGEILAMSGRRIEGASSYWVATAPIRLLGFAACVCMPELALRFAWRTWCAATVAAGDTVSDIEIVMPDSGKWNIPEYFKQRWPLVLNQA
jgi:hypothetical protein